MKKKDFVILCLRLLGIFIGVMGLSYIPHLATLFKKSHTADLSFYLSPITYTICGIVLFVYAPKISHFIIDFSEAEEGDVQITSSEKTTRIAFLVLGVYLFAQSLPQFVQVSVHTLIYYKKYTEIEKHLRGTYDEWTLLIGPFIRLIISAILIIGPDKIVGIISKHDETFERIKSSNNGVEQIQKK